jgi:hypothetical protein
MAKRHGMNIESSIAAVVRLPASTDFNRINWVLDKRLEGIHSIDNILHSGAVKGDDNNPARNIAASLSVFNEVINRIADGLTRFERVIVTADHGSTRLAIIAHEKGFVKTLAWDGEPKSWRCAVASTDSIERPNEFVSSYDEKNNLTYWVVRGYNRLPKKGGNPNEIHDGATLEERLVPVIVFSKTKTDQSYDKRKQTAPQLIEKSGYDIN